MAKLLVIYKTPVDTEAFDTHYREVHLPIAGQMPHVQKVEISNGPIVSPTGANGVYRVAEISFGSMEDLQESLASPAGQRAAADLPNFATGGCDLLVFDSQAL